MPTDSGAGRTTRPMMEGLAQAIGPENVRFLLGLVLGALVATVVARWQSPRPADCGGPDRPRGGADRKPLAPSSSPERTAPERTEEQGTSDQDEEEEEEEEEEDEEEKAKAAQAGQEEAQPPDAPRFPFLRIGNLLPESTPLRLFPNTRRAEVLDGKYAGGRALVALRVRGAEDPHFEPFFRGKSRKIEVQFQLTFKEEPRGILYVGGELPKRMQLGVVTKGLCRAILAIMNRLSAFIHAGFGKNMNDIDERELPHIVFPVWAAASKLVVTRAGEGPPPELGKELPEPAAESKLRLKRGFNQAGSVRKGDTLTFSFHSMYLDVVRWKATNLGALGDMDLSMFWDTMPLHLVMYDLEGFNMKEHKLHSSTARRSYFGFAISNSAGQRADGEPLVIYPNAGTRAGADSRRPSVRFSDVVEGNEDDPEDEVGSMCSRDSSGPLVDEEPGGDAASGQMRPPKNNQLELSTADLRVVAWVEHSARRKRSVSFVLAKKDGTQLFLQERQSFFSPDLPPTLHLFNEGLPRRPKKVWEWESLRTHLDSALLHSERVTLPPGWITTERALLQARAREEMGVLVSSKVFDFGQCLFESAVVRPLWETKWREEWAVLVETTGLAQPAMYLMLFQTGSKQPVLVISSGDFLSVREVAPRSLPFASFFSVAEVATKGRVLLFGFASQELRQRFLGLCRRHVRQDAGLGRGETDLAIASNVTTISLGYEANRWGAQKRTVLNARQVALPGRLRLRETESGASGAFALASPVRGGPSDFNCFRQSSAALAAPYEPERGREDILSTRRRLEQAVSPKPWELTATLLRTVLRLDESSSVADQVHFFDLAAQLRLVDIVSWAKAMTEEEKFCFAINLYHALRLHAKFLVGQPSSLIGWATFGARISYAIGSGSDAMVLSLAEIEHCILRKPMSLARSFLATSYPTSRFTEMLALERPEPRLNFCLNYGTRSCTEGIAVFHSPSLIDRHLDEAAAHFLQDLLKVDMARGVIFLPKLCSWYGRDFVPGSRDLTTRMIGCEVVEYVGDAQRIRIAPLVEHHDVVYKVRGFKWKCLERHRELPLS